MLTCKGCGVTNAEVEEDYDPFDSEIHGDYTLVCLCPDCYDERAREI